jgi:hypothetical protein
MAWFAATTAASSEATADGAGTAPTGVPVIFEIGSAESVGPFVDLTTPVARRLATELLSPKLRTARTS